MQVELDYPRDMSMWRGIGYEIDSAFQYKDGKNARGAMIDLKLTIESSRKNLLLQRKRLLAIQR